MMIKKCLYCGEEFEANSSSQKFCCVNHRSKYKWQNEKSFIKKCKNCGKEFTTKSKRTQFCSQRCSGLFTQDQVKQTCLNKYGVEYVLQSNIVKEKKKQTCLKKYGVEYVTQADFFKEQWKHTCLEKYGFEYASQSQEFINHRKQTCLEKYGVEHISQTQEWKYKHKKTCLEKYGKVSFLLTDDCPKPGVISKQNKKRADFIHESTGLDIEYEFRGIDGYSYDLKVGKYLIEIDPIVTHNSSKSFFKHSEPKNKYYHQKKSLAAEQAGYHCIHLFDWDDNEQVKNWLIGLLTKRKNLHNGKIMKVDGKEAEKFYDANHLQGKCSATVHYGIYVKGELINCMSFTCFKGEWTLVRFASKMGFRIYQGAGRLFRTFIREYNPDYIVSFSDITKHSGGLYNALGFVLDRINAPSYWWVDKTGTHIHWRRDCQKQNMHKLAGFDPDYKYLEHKDNPFWQQTENELMESHGYLKVFDAGMRKHVWYKKKD